MNITDLCFKLITIKDNREYHYAKYGDFIVIMIKSDDYTNGFINATKLCQLGDKRYDKWLKLDYSIELIKEFSNGQNWTLENIEKNNLFFKLLGGKGNDFNIIRGTYVNKKLILNIAIWISPNFYLKIFDIVENYLIKNFKDELSLNK
jgi:hypothetical protein